MDDHLRSLATHNGGYLHRADILQNAGSDEMIRHAMARGELRRIRVGTYAFANTWDPLQAQERHVVLARSVIDKFPAGSVALSHHSAAAVHGIELYDVDLSAVHLVRLDGGSGRRESNVVHHDARPLPADLMVVDERLVVCPSRAVWEVACMSSARGALVVMDSALHQGLILPEHLADQSGRYRAWPGARSARLWVRLADGGAENPGETLFRFTCFEAKLPRPDTQVPVTDAEGDVIAFTDLGWELYRHCGEFDGLRKYWRDLRPGEDASDVVVREKVREDRIRSLDLGMTRSTWAEVQPDRSEHTGARLAHDLERSHRLYGRGRRHIA
ncbi:hypothetical protein [Aeromicrobium sp. CTD01-1L150]|uniref:hypothetical protein n=1 Tax=Aeromicrobium sp. CTD01-1L150 TaxID=3341830 RepID=UPI0035C14544